MGIRGSVLAVLAGSCVLSLSLPGCDLLEPLTDAAAPRIEVDASVDTIWADSLLPVSGRAVDHVGVERVTFRVNDGPETDIPIRRGRYVEFSGEVPIRDAGLNQVLLTAYDAHHNHGSDAVTVREDLSGPVVELQMPDSVMATDTIPVQAIVRDPSRVARVTLVYGVGTRDVPVPHDTTVSLDTYLVLIAGKHALHIEAEDGLGNVSTSDSVIVVSDKAAPVIRLYAPVLTVGDSARIAATVVDHLERFGGATPGRVDRIVAVQPDSTETVLWSGGAVSVDVKATLSLAPGADAWTVAAYDQMDNRGLASVSTWRIEPMDVAASDGTTCVVDPTGAAWCWGDNTYGELGIDDHTIEAIGHPLRVTGAHVFTQITAGTLHLCGLDNTGAAWCWGTNWHGESGQDGGGVEFAPMAVSGGHTFTQVVAGASHTCGLDESGFAWCWGSNSGGLLGTGDTIPSYVPVGNSDRSYQNISLSTFYTCAVGVDGNVYCWGDYPAAATSSTTPVQVTDGVQFVRVRTGMQQACAIDVAGNAWCWGTDLAGNIVAQPRQLTALGPITDIALGRDNTCALGTDHVLRCWGANDRGQCGTGDTASPVDPPEAALQGMTFRQTLPTAYGMCGVDTRGSLYCWGSQWPY